MKIGVCSANSGPYTTRDMLAALARHAEATGIESIWVSDHVVVADPREPPSPMGPEDPILDPVTALAFLAGRTDRVRLGTGVVVLPLREPVVLAKQLATVDVLSEGRLIFGVGVGYVPREFEAVGVPFEERADRLEEFLEAIRSLWGDDRPAYAGRAVGFDGVRSTPRPVQRPHPPIVMGGYAPPVMRRAIRDADGWYGWGLDLAATERRIAILRSTAMDTPRRDGLGELEITITPPEEIDLETANRYEDLGVHRLNVQLPWGLEVSGLTAFFEDAVRPLIELHR